MGQDKDGMRERDEKSSKRQLWRSNMDRAWAENPLCFLSATRFARCFPRPFASSHGGNDGSPCLGGSISEWGESCLYMGLLAVSTYLQNLFLPHPDYLPVHSYFPDFSHGLLFPDKGMFLLSSNTTFQRYPKEASSDNLRLQ